MTTIVIGFLAMFALVLFVLAGLNVPEAPRFKYGGWGLACLTLAAILFFGPGGGKAG